MPRIPGPARRARALAALAAFLRGDREFRRMAADLRTQKGEALTDGIAGIKRRLSLPDTDWAEGYLTELVERFDDPSRLATLVRHWRPAHEFDVTVKGTSEQFLVDPEGPSPTTVTSSFDIHLGGSTEPPDVRPGAVGDEAASTLRDLERLSNAPRKARRWWDEQGLPKGRQPTETLRRDTYLFYLVRWRGFTLARAAGVVADLGDQGKMTERSRRGSSARDELLSHTAVRKAVQRIEALLR